MLKQIHAVVVIASLANLAQAQQFPHTSALLTLTNEQEAVIHAGRACNVVSEREMTYWYKQTSFAVSSMLTEADEAAFTKQRVSPRNMNLVEARANGYGKDGCTSTDLLNKVAYLKRSMRLNGLSLKQLDEAHASALQDLNHNTAH